MDNGVKHFSCNCKTTKAAKDYLEGKISRNDLGLALLHHENHACPDFVKIYNLLSPYQEDDQFMGKDNK